MKSMSVIFLLVGAILMLSACATTHGYKKVDIDPKFMSRSIDIGSYVEIETKKSVYRITVTGYEEDIRVIGIEEFDGREVRIPFDEIIEIGTGEPTYEFINLETRYFSSELASIILGIILIALIAA